MNKDDDKRILSVEEILHLQSDTHEKKEKIMPDVDTSRYVLRQKPKTETARTFAPVVNITEEQRKQFSQGDNSLRSRDSVLAEQARNAIKLVEKHAEEEAIEHAKAAEDKNSSDNKTPDNAEKKLVKAIRGGDFDFSFGALIEGSENLKETI